MLAIRTLSAATYRKMIVVALNAQLLRRVRLAGLTQPPPAPVGSDDLTGAVAR